MKTFKGSFFEIGKQQGELYRQNGLNLSALEINKKVVDEQIRVYQKYCPEQLEEIDGIAAGGNFDKEQLLYFYLAIELVGFTKRFNMPLSCTIFGVKNKNGTFVGRNLDWLPITGQVMEPYTREADGRYKLLAISDMFIGDPKDVENKYLIYDAIDVINEKGLFVGITFAYGDTWSYGLSWKEITRMIGERCSTVEEAITLFKDLPVCVPKNFFIADKQGNMAVVEHNAKSYKVVYPTNDILIQTNHYLDPELAKIDQVLISNPNHNTFKRYEATMQKLMELKENFSLPDVISILGDTNSVVCQNSYIQTIWTLALHMNTQEYKLYSDVTEKKIEQDLHI